MRFCGKELLSCLLRLIDHVLFLQHGWISTGEIEWGHPTSGYCYYLYRYDYNTWNGVALGSAFMEQVKNDWKCSKQNETLKARDSSPQNLSACHILPISLELWPKASLQVIPRGSFLPIFLFYVSVHFQPPKTWLEVSFIWEAKSYIRTFDFLILLPKLIHVSP